MDKLNKNWITEGLIDFEYKKYILLGYLKNVAKQFKSQKLYPHLSDLIAHYHNLYALKKNKESTLERFPKELKKLDFKNLSTEFTSKMPNQSEVLEEIDSILRFALPQLQHYLEEGKDIYELIEEKIHIEPVGIKPIDARFGYILLRSDKRLYTRVFEYQITLFENAKEKYRGIKTTYLTSYKNSFMNTLGNIKIDLVKKYKKLPNPSTYLIYSELDVPLKETLLPIAKRSLVRYISNAA